MHNYFIAFLCLGDYKINTTLFGESVENMPVICSAYSSSGLLSVTGIPEYCILGVPITFNSEFNHS